MRTKEDVLIACFGGPGDAGVSSNIYNFLHLLREMYNLSEKEMSKLTKILEPIARECD